MSLPFGTVARAPRMAFNGWQQQQRGRRMSRDRDSRAMRAARSRDMKTNVVIVIEDGKTVVKVGEPEEAPREAIAHAQFAH